MSGRTRTGVTVVVLTVALVLTACSGGTKTKAGGKSASPVGLGPINAAKSAAAAASSAGNAATAEAGACDAAPLEVKAALAPGGYVTDVKILGHCTTVSVSTSLKADADGAAAAQGICEIAAAQGYSHGVGAVSVESADGKELAAGIKGSPCIAEPR